MYKNEDSHVEIKMTEIKVNWKPRSFNRLLRFMRYMKFKGDVFDQQMAWQKFRYEQAKIRQAEQNLRIMETSKEIEERKT